MTPSRWQRRVRRLLAEIWFFGRGLRVLVRPGLALAVTCVVGAGIAHDYGAVTDDGTPLPWAEAAFTVWSMMMGGDAPGLPAHPLGQALYYALPLLGILFIAEGVLKLGFTVFNKQANTEAWVSIHARTSRGHIILCGLGTVGFRVMEELHELGHEVYIVERDGTSNHVALAREMGIDVIVGDARADNLLRGLNVAGARAVIVATDDDLANLEIAMDVREVRADIPIILRLFDQRLAQKVKGALGIEISVSTSKLAAPLFASAALDTSVVGTHRVGEQLLVVMELNVQPAGRLAGRTVAEVAALARANVVAIRQPGAPWTVQPGPDDRIDPFMDVQLMVPGVRTAEVRALAG